jgi:transposase
MEAYSKDLRMRVLRDCDAGVTTRVVATKYDVSESWVRRLKQRRRETGETMPRQAGSPRPARWLEYADRLQELVRAQPDITLRELREAIDGQLSIQTLSRALRALQWTFKKKSFTRLSKTGPTSNRSAPNGKPR